MFDKFKYRNVTKLIDHFDALLADVGANRDEYVGWQGRGFMQSADRDDPVVQNSLNKVDDWLAKAITIGRYPQKTDLENKQMGELLNEEWNGEKAEIQERMVEWIDFCLVARENNEDIWDLAPYLKEYKDNE